MLLQDFFALLWARWMSSALPNLLLPSDPKAPYRIGPPRTIFAMQLYRQSMFAPRILHHSSNFYLVNPFRALQAS